MQLLIFKILSYTYLIGKHHNIIALYLILSWLTNSLLWISRVKLRGGERVAWPTLVLYFEAFTFDKENLSKFLTIPNHIAILRLGTTILHCFGLLDLMQNGVRFLALCGNILRPLCGY